MVLTPADIVDGFDAIVSAGNNGESRAYAGPDEIVIDDAGVRVNAVVRTDTSRFEPKITIGPYNKDSDALLSSWVQDDWSGGALIANHNEGATDSRFRWSTAWTLNRTQLALPPLRVSTSLTADAGSLVPRMIPLAEWLDSSGNIKLWVSNGKRVHAVTHSGGNVFNSGGNRDLTYAPVNKGAIWNSKLWIPCGSAIVDLTNAAVIGTEDTTVKAVAVQTWDKRLFALTSDGYLRYRTTAGTWDSPPSEDRRVTSDQTPIDLCEFYDRQGNLTVFILTNKQLWSYDPVSDTILPTSVAWPRNVSTCFTPWRDEAIYIATGLGVERYTRDGVRTPMGLDRDYGLPSSLLSASGLAIRTITGSRNFLVAVVSNTESPSTTDAYLMVWNEQGWHCLATIPAAKGVNTPQILVSDSIGATGKQYRIWYGGAGDAFGGTAVLQSWALSRDYHGPLQNILRTVGEFELTATHDTGWFDAGMEGFDKLLSHLEIEATPVAGTSYSGDLIDPPDVAVAVFYRTDADPDTWVSLGSTENAGVTVLPFGLDPDGFSRGLGCNRVEFRYILTSTSSSKSPIIDHTNLKFIVLSQPGAAWTADVPLDQENENGLGPRAISDWLAELTYTRRFVKMIHRGKTYRVRIAQHASAESTGDIPFSRDSISIVECRINASADVEIGA